MNSTDAIPEEEYERSRSRKRLLQRISTEAIMATRFSPIRWVVEDYLPEGLSILAGRQKLGKTWLAIDWAIAVASGGLAMGSIGCQRGDVLYIDLENGQRRIQNRIETIFSGNRNRPGLERLEWAQDAPDLDKGLLEALEDWRVSVEDPRLVVIDVLQRVKPVGKARQNAYESDYDVLSTLQRWATDRRVAVLCLHHTRKAAALDPLEELSGSNGLSACADTTLLLKRDGQGMTLYVRGRDVEEKESALDFFSGRWRIDGDAAAVRRTNERSRLLSALLKSDIAMSPGELAMASDMSRNNVDQLLRKMVDAGEVVKIERGRYLHPDRPHAATDR